MDTTPENACAACGYVIGTAGDRMRVTAVDILLDALFGSNEAPLKRALLDEGIAHDVNAFVADSMQQPFAVVQTHMPEEGVGKRLSDLIAGKVRAMLEAGLDKELIEAALSHEEFQMREHDMGMADGVVHAIIALSGWLYDDGAATDYLRYEDVFSMLRDHLADNYFERLCAELFLENDHTASVEVTPTPGTTDDDARERLAKMNADLTARQREQIVAEEALLRELQEAPDTPAAMATLPRLGVADIDDVPDDPPYALDASTPVPCLRHGVDTHGIVYAYRYFDLSTLAFEDLPYATLLALTLGKLDTANHTAAEIDTLTQGKLGNLSLYTETFEVGEDVTELAPKFVVSASALSENTEWLATLPREVLVETNFTDTGKILDILKQRKISLEHAFMNTGHSCAAARACSYYTPSGIVREQLGNVGFYQFLCDLIEHFDERAAELPEKLAKINDMIDEETEAGFLTYKNNGTNVTKDYELYIPVTLNYGWGSISKTITVKVYKTTDSFQNN